MGERETIEAISKIIENNVGGGRLAGFLNPR